MVELDEGELSPEATCKEYLLLEFPYLTGTRKKCFSLPNCTFTIYIPFV
jgi:hypothetical protein